MVYLVGAGPGDPGLITVRGVECLRQADFVVYDRLSNAALLEHAPAGADRVFMGKEPETPSAFQQAISATLVQAARGGKTVVRLKGGDPFVFGRGGEEIEELRAAGIPFEVVPGITSAVAVPAYAGIPVTHRGVATAFTVVSGSEDPDKPESSLDWPALAKTPGTLVVLMGWRSLPRIIASLIANGRPADTPVAVTQWGTLPSQRTVSGTLADIVERGMQAKIASPVVTVIGHVAALRDTMRWFDRRPLFGKRILVTRSRRQASALSKLIAEQGGEAVELPTIDFQPLDSHAILDEAIGNLRRYRWVVFTSVNAVDVVWARLAALGKDTRAFGDARVAAVGPATAEALAARGIRADFVPETSTSEGVARAFRGYDLVGAAVLLPRADIATDALPAGLRTEGAVVDDVPAYRNVVPPDVAGRAREIVASDTLDAAAFTSSSTVRNLIDLLGGNASALERTRIVCIGPSTARAAREVGLRVDAIATEHTVQGLLRALVEQLTHRSVER